MKTMRIFSAFSLMSFFACLSLTAGNAEHWGEYGLNYNFNQSWHLVTDYQMRVRDDIRDYYWWRYEIGPGVRFCKWLDLRVLYRHKSQESAPGKWQGENNLFIEPALKLYGRGKESFDVRLRIHTRLGDTGRQFIRIRPRFTHRFNIGWRKCNWYIYNDFWLQTSALGPRDRYNTNWLNSGFKWQLYRNIDLTTFFQYRSDKLPAGGGWDHDPCFGTSLVFNFARIGRYF